MDLQDTADFLESKTPLDRPPIGLAFVDEQPNDVDRIEGAVPSSCAFWREAETDVFYASAQDHYNCTLGAMVMGFPLPDEQMQLLMQDVGMMCETEYVREEEVPNVPKVEGRPTGGIVYGPLSRMPVDPDVVLIWATPRQAMVIGESAGLMNWAAGPAGVYGRPGCAAIPIALSQGRTSQSFGCTGMRINSGVPDEYMLMAVPADNLDSLVQSLDKVTQTHSLLTDHYNQKAESIRK